MDTQVIIIGGGPCGLLSALLLARQGVRCMVLEKHPDISYHPKAMGVTRRTGEIYRSLGLLDAMETADLKGDLDALSIWSRSLTGEILGKVEMPKDPEGMTPCRRFHCPQPHTEAVLRGALEAEPLATVCFHTLATDIRTTGGGIEVAYTRRDTGETDSVRADWLIAADGADSPVREQLGIATHGPGDLGHFLNVYFRARYGKHIKDRKAILYHALGEEYFENFVAVNGDDLWLMHHFLDENETAADFSFERLHDTVQFASGLPQEPVEIIHVSPWVMSPKVAGTWRSGHCFLVGDAAARLSPAGGLGMNTGMAGVHNLAWKLAAVIHGQAGDALLDSYEAERLPAAQATFASSLGNAQEVRAIIEEGLAGHWNKVRELITHSRRAGSGLGLDLGFVYAQGAFIPDGSLPPAPRDPINDYIPEARPGCRAPHLSITVGGQLFSMLDFFGEGFCLLCGPQGEAWRNAAAEPEAAFTVKVEGADFGDTGGHFAELYEIGPAGAVLVRPDGYVAARWSELQVNSLAPALQKILCRA